MAMNLIILGAAGFVYSWDSAMYSLVAYFIAYKMIDITITGLEESKGVMIITDAENSTFLSDTLDWQFPSHHGVKPRTFKTDWPIRLRALYAQ